MVMLSPSNYLTGVNDTTDQHDDNQNNQNAKVQENCWRIAESNTREAGIAGNEENGETVERWRNVEDGSWRCGGRGQGDRNQWTRSMVENAARDVYWKTDGDSERNLMRNLKCKSVSNFWPASTGCRKDVGLDGWKKTDTKANYIWRSPSGQLVSPMGSQGDPGLKCVSSATFSTTTCQLQGG